jgi:hypothetical protein
MRYIESDVNPDLPFSDCRLRREACAKILTQMVENYASGFVLAIDNELGSGKTFFLRRWHCMLLKLEFNAVYFNAWEHDFETSTLAALLSEFKQLVPKASKDSIRALVSKGSEVLKGAVPVVAKSLVKKYLGEDAAGIIEKSTESISGILKEQVDDFNKKKEGLIDFRRQLAEIIAEGGGKKPLVFILDELDRCSPSYAVEILERIKHFFNVPGIVFVLGIDKTQLLHSIRGYYNSESFDAVRYLRRFIDLEYSLPRPDPRDFCNYLYEYYDFDSFFSLPERSRNIELREDGQIFLEYTNFLVGYLEPPLRDLQKLFAHARVSLTFFKPTEYSVPLVFALLNFIRLFDQKLYRVILRREVKPISLLPRLQGGVLDIPTNHLRDLHIAALTTLWVLYNNLFRSSMSEDYIDIRDPSGIGKIQLGPFGEGQEVFKTKFNGLLHTRIGVFELTPLMAKLEMAQHFRS